MQRVLNDEQLREALKLKSQGYSMRKIGSLLAIPRSTIWDNVFRSKKAIKLHIRMQGLSKCDVCEIYMTPEIDIKTRFIPMNYKIKDTCLTCYLKQRGVHYRDVMALLDYYGK